MEHDRVDVWRGAGVQHQYFSYSDTNSVIVNKSGIDRKLGGPVKVRNERPNTSDHNVNDLRIV